MAVNGNMQASDRELIAVIGSGFRFPGSSTNPSKLWDLLLKPRDLLTKIPDNRWNADTYYHPNPAHHGTSNVKETYFLEQDHRLFDANFFNIKPVEAHAIDPQQRLLMEVVYESLEASGTSIESLAGSGTGVYVGLMCGDYQDHLNSDMDFIPTYTPTGNARSIMSNRISYFFDWHGPSMTIDTACSSSLVAVHQAVQLLRSGDSNVAVACGSNLILGPLQYVCSSKLHMLSADSRSRMWDIDASGYARGEGVAAVVLKRLSDAIADGDNIECIIRESGVNQDGRTKGITMPSSTAQADLITRTYAKAGLDPKDSSQRCQYFEAHGTGTAAGDPKEAEAISKSFFHLTDHVAKQKQDPLYVGSIKTVVGHTEGTAGLAGLIKASLAVQHGIVPPNFLFNKLHPAVEPFYTNLEIVTSPKPWPLLPEGTPRRASVNSFGFGGTNAHIIIENYIPEPERNHELSPPTRQFTPFNFSASSENALRGILEDYSIYLQTHPGVSLQDLSYTLYGRRSEHSVRVSMSAQSATSMQEKISGLLGENSIGVRAKTLSSQVRVLGVFTGQGAQWPTMGRELILNYPRIRETIQEMDMALQKLPEPERPDWSLMNELLCDASESRLRSAVIAQPLCTVVQIVLYELLTTADIKFDAVVGHSSGEIAAAYAAGYLSRDDALKVAYYRGYFTNLALSDHPGGMMAVGTSVEDASELCRLPRFEGRLVVAAVNSSSSVTISGDLDAIREAKEVLDDEKKFSRVLLVDKAYHSSHMLPCVESYIAALKRANIQLQQQAPGRAVWFSSTYENREMGADSDLLSQYWANNMVRPVLFSHAVESVAACDIAIEVGPHATLKGPVLQSLTLDLPYTGLLQRGKDDVEAFSDALGYLWSLFAPSIVDFSKFDASLYGPAKRKLIHELPTYHWDHEKIFWHESRASKAFLHRKDIPNQLLGSRVTGLMEQELRWRNNLKISEIPWARGHALQGQVIYPATGYIATAVEAARYLVPEQKDIAMIEVEDFSLGKPLVFKDNDSGIETLFALSNISQDGDGTRSASFAYHGSSSADTEMLSIHATGRVTVTTGEPSSELLPSQKNDPPNTVGIPEEQFYSSLEPLGYAYSGPFRTLSSINRKLNYSSAKIRVPSREDEPERVLLHPSLLDSALQGIFLAYCWPGDGSLEQLHVPTGIKSFRVNVPMCREKLVPDTDIPTCSHLTGNPLITKQLNGDVEIFAEDGTGLVQFEGIKIVAFSEPTSETDRAMFSEHQWALASPNAELAMGGARATASDYEAAFAIERVCVYFMKKVSTLFPEHVRKDLNLEWHFYCLFEFFENVIETLQAGTRQSSHAKWLKDTEDDIAELKAKFGHRVDMQLTFAVGKNLPAVLRGETTILEHMTKDNLLDRFYEVGVGLNEYSHFLSKTVKQLVHRHPRMKILEIGAGTGGATKIIMGDIGRSFSQYTYTDISTGFFETAQDVFAPYADKMIFKMLNAENDITEQGFEEHSYDLVVASLVLHATADLNQTLANTRRLLKPGGYLVMTEISNNDVSRLGFMMCALSGWWLGQNDGRRLSPCVSTSEWHQLLLQNGFDGVNSATPDFDASAFPLAVIVSQAVDDCFNLLREPLSPAGIEALAQDNTDLVLIGGRSLGSILLIEQILRLIQPSGICHTIFKTLADVDRSKISAKSAILCLTELDDPVFERLSPETFEGLKKLLENQKTVLWVTKGCRSENPYMSMSVGLGRSLVLENPDLTLQFIDLEVDAKPNPRQLLEALLRLRQGAIYERDGRLDGMLWTNEHELAYQNGELMVARVYRSDTLNKRINASKRKISELMSPQAVPIIISLDASSNRSLLMDDHLAAAIISPEAITAGSNVLIKVSHSLSVDIPASYLIVGTDMATDTSVVAISANNGSYVLVHSEKVLEVESLEGRESQLLTQLNILLQVENILSICGRHSIVLIHDPSPEIASRIAELTPGRNVTAFFSTSSSVISDQSFIKLDAYPTKRVIEPLLPTNVSVFIDCSAGGQAGRTGSLIAECLPQSCLRTTISSINTLHLIRDFSAVQFGDVVQQALGAISKSSYSFLVTGLEELIGQSGIDQPAAVIINWSCSPPVPVQLSTISSQVTFKGDKTYVLFGLTSDLAQSTCDWMAAHGARNIVLTSRNPNINTQWVNLLALAEVRVEVFSNDITNKEALFALVDNIRQSWPPIAGIAHGAMILDDIAFFEMPYEKMNKVLRPKVKGAMYLDELFQDASLDFFVLFSSVTCIAGNRGQSAYTAANMFMSALATQRRAKGIAASILHIGAVMGVGYVNRSFSTSILTALRKTGYMMMSERDFQLCFGEAVMASHPFSGRSPEVVTGLGTIPLGADLNPPWAKFPRFQYCIKADEGGDKKVKTKTAAVSLKVQLQDAITPEDVLEIVSNAFFLKLQVSLQLQVDQEKAQVLSSGTDDLGIDSLVAVEIRSWFLKEVETEIPVFKISSGGSILELVDFVVENMPAGLTPNLGDSARALRPDAPAIVQVTADNASSAHTSEPNNSAEASQQSDEHDKGVTTSATSTAASFSKFQSPASRESSQYPPASHDFGFSST